MSLGELENSQSTLQRCLELDPTFVDAHLLMSQIYLAQGNFAMCSHCLELGVSHNFQVGALYTLRPIEHPFLDHCWGGGAYKGIGTLLAHRQGRLFGSPREASQAAV